MRMAGFLPCTQGASLERPEDGNCQHRPTLQQRVRGEIGHRVRRQEQNVEAKQRRPNNFQHATTTSNSIRVGVNVLQSLARGSSRWINSDSEASDPTPYSLLDLIARPHDMTIVDWDGH